MENKPKFKRALNFNVVVEPIVLENKTDGGFDISGFVSKNESQQSGKVVSIGELCPKDKDGNHYIQIGDIVLFNGSRSTTMTISSTKFIVVSYSELSIVV